MKLGDPIFANFIMTADRPAGAFTSAGFWLEGWCTGDLIASGYFMNCSFSIGNKEKIKKNLVE